MTPGCPHSDSGYMVAVSTVGPKPRTRARAQALKGEKPVRGLRCSARFRGARAGFLAVPGFLGASRDRGAVGAQVKERAWRAQGQNADCQPQNVTDTRTKCVFRTRFPARARGRGFGFCRFLRVGVFQYWHWVLFLQAEYAYSSTDTRICSKFKFKFEESPMPTSVPSSTRMYPAGGTQHLQLPGS